MATATKVPADYQIQLTLSREEAESLFHITHKVSGSTSGARGHIDAIRVALEREDVNRSRATLRGGLDLGD